MIVTLECELSEIKDAIAVLRKSYEELSEVIKVSMTSIKEDK
jgi:hypothetical protein